MSQVNPYLRRCSDGYILWCPGCESMHLLPDSWSFNGNVDKPTFTPSFRHTGVKQICDQKGEWTGEWAYDEKGDPVNYVCHYILTDGILNFCGDCTHDLVGKRIPLPELPKEDESND